MTAGVSPDVVGVSAAASILDALATVPRHLFVAPEYQMVAYLDRSLPVGFGRRCPRPAVVARLLDACSRLEGATLVVGGGTGYVPACVAELASRVVAVEGNAALADASAVALGRIRTRDRVTLRAAVPSTRGAEPEERFDAIVVCAAVAQSPRWLLSLLRPGGTLVVPQLGRFETTLHSYQGVARGHVHRELGVIDVEPLPDLLTDEC
ncbi:MAG: hypothetical protein H6698_01285 [Myxococcales bacterium]|nr:hypothetical protein [Myxococcales bacterium]MCB9532943.1 hypothetical protein [Myxococcales bacterium]